MLVSSVLHVSTAETLHQYESHFKAIEDLYAPELERFEALAPSDCRRGAETILNTTTTTTGYASSNCASSYDSRVKYDISVATKAIVDIDDFYSQVQSIVVQAFVGQNAFLTPEDIKNTITEIYELVSAKWEETKPKLQSIRDTLETSITNQNRILGTCHTSIFTSTTNYFESFRSMIQTCIDFDNTPEPFGKGKSVAPYIIILQEFEEAIARAQPFVWE